MTPTGEEHFGDRRPDLPEELPTTPFEVVALRTYHLHGESDEDEGGVGIEFAFSLPGVSDTSTMAFVVGEEQALTLVEDLAFHLRRIGNPELCQEEDE